MHPFAEELKKAREFKSIPLASVAAATNISSRVLKALESGDFRLLPRAYMRAFVKEYAAYLGLDPGETSLRFERALEELNRLEAAKRGTDGRSHEHVPLAQRTRRTSFRVQTWVTDNVPQVLVTSLGVLVLIVVSWLFLHSTRRDTVTSPVREVPFQQVLKESEQAAGVVTKSALALSPKEKAAVSKIDSLVLQATTTDSVWMSLVIDDRDTSEYLFGPKEGKAWKAHEHFSVTLGNAGGMTFTLNERPIGALGKPGAVVRNVQLPQRESTQQE